MISHYLLSGVLFVSFGLLGAQKRQIPASYCGGPPLAPKGYDINNISQTLLSPDFVNSFMSTCSTDGNGNYYDSNSCTTMLSKAEDTIYNLYAMSDTDLWYTYQGLYPCNTWPGWKGLIEWVLSAMNILNTTVNGMDTGPGATPGIFRNLMTILDGISEIQAVSSGQMTSLKQAASNQRQSTQNIRQQLSATASTLRQQTLDFMGMLVANRTLVQKTQFQAVGQSVADSIADIQAESDEISNTATSDLQQLQDQYNQWTLDTNAALSDVTNKSQALKSQTNLLSQQAMGVVSSVQSTQSGLVSQSFRSTVNDFNADLISAQKQVGGDVGQLGSDMASMVAQNAAGFSASVNSYQSDMDGQLSSTSSDIGNNPTLLSNSENDATQKAQVSLGNLVTVMESSVLPLINNAKSAMQSVVTLQALIQAAQNQVNSDAASIENPANANAISLGKQVSIVFPGYQSNFDAQFNSIRSQMLSQISDKVAAGRMSLQQILNSVSSTQGGAASQQQLEGKVSQSQTSASMDAANLINAQAQNAAETTQTGLDSMVGMVGGALSDAQDTLQQVGAANVGQITSLTGQLQAGQQAATQQAYSQLNSASDQANGMASKTQRDSNSAQLTGINLQNSIKQAGSSLQGSVANQNSQAQQLLSDVGEILRNANLSGGSLADQMSNFEKQMPALYQVLVSKISAFQALMSSQGASAEAGASAAVEADATGSLALLMQQLQDITSNTTGTSTSMSAQQAATAGDASSVLNDIKLLNSQLGHQGVNGAGAVSAAAQEASSKTNSEVQSASQHSAAAVTALMQFNADLIESTRSAVLDSGNAAMNSALNSAKYLTPNAQNYSDLSNQFVRIAQNVENAGDTNLTMMLNKLNSTLISIQNNAQHSGNQLSRMESQMSAWPGQMSVEESNLNAAIHAKIAEISRSITDIDGISSNNSGSTQKIATELQNYIDQLSAVHQEQRSTFNRFSQQYALRRISLLTGLNATVVAQKAAFLQSLASTDLDQNSQASQTSTVLTGLANALEAASQQGGMDSNRLASMVANIGSGVSSLTQSLANQMNTQVSSLKQQAISNAMNVGKSVGSTVDGASSQAHLLGNQFANALQQIGGSDTAIQLAAAGSNKDAYSIASLLNSTSQSTRVQIASLLREVEAGNLTMQEVLESTQNMSNARVSTVEDVIKAFTSQIAAHVSNADEFENSIELSTKSLNATAAGAVLPHTGLEADIISEIAAEAQVMHDLRTSLLPGTGANARIGEIQEITNNRSQTLQALENNVTNVLYGSNVNLKSMPSGSSNFLQSYSRNASVSNVSLTGSVSASSQMTLPDMISQVGSIFSTAQTNSTRSQATESILIQRIMNDTNSQIQKIISLTASELGVSVSSFLQV